MVDAMETGLCQFWGVCSGTISLLSPVNNNLIALWSLGQSGLNTHITSI